MTERLRRLYGSPNHGNKADPLDELVFIILSLMTTGPSFNRAYERLREFSPDWETLLSVTDDALEATIRDAGLSNQKAPRLRAIVRRLQEDFGEVSLDALQTMSDAEAEGYLVSLPGVGVKAAKCVMMYSLGRNVLPVDTHVWRVARRLGLIAPDLPYSRSHRAAEAAVRPADRYSFHVNAVAHGQNLCLALRPRCGSCPLRRMCPYYRVR